MPDPYIDDGDVVLYQGDCIEVMAALPEASVDAVVTDPPYALPGGFMGKSWDRLDGRSDIGACYHLAGLIDGEGCFRVQRHERGSHSCTFSMQMRADDGAILRRAAALVGVGVVSKHGHNGGNPMVRWAVQDQDGCVALVGFLRRFPLRAKKAVDFEAWAEAVGEWVGRPRGNRWSGPADQTRAAALKARIEAAREFRDVPWSGHRFQDWCREWSEEALRVLKPGGHALVFGGTRTFHRMTCGLEDAGFEIRDCLSWLYGSGFPKSLDVSKAIDRRRDDGPAIRTVTAYVAAARESAGVSLSTIDAAFGFNGMASHWTTGGAQAAVPTWEQWERLRSLLDLGDEMDDEVWRLNGRKGTPGEAWAEREKVGEIEVPVGHAFAGATYGGDSSSQVVDVTAPATPEAAAWVGWGTALKPGWEPIVLARKPLAGTVAANVTEHGTGGLNIDGSRIGWATDTEQAEVNARTAPNSRHLPENSDGATGWGSGRVRSRDDLTSPAGRWPANVVLDEEAGAMLDAEVGERPGMGKGRVLRRGATGAGMGYGSSSPQDSDFEGYGDTGGPSRFFYTAKASTSERGEGNTHPTVKPLALMRWCIRLITPPGGVVLDPFAGSGTTLRAARDEGLRAVGIERDAEYLAIAARRLAQLSLLGGADA